MPIDSGVESVGALVAILIRFIFFKFGPEPFAAGEIDSDFLSSLLDKYLTQSDPVIIVGLNFYPFFLGIAAIRPPSIG